MGAGVMAEVIALADRIPFATIDLTGGAPELHPQVRHLVEAVSEEGRRVLLRTNLVALELPETQGLIDLLALHRVELEASLPCYLEENVDAQRGAGTYAASIRVLKHLNERGYGRNEGQVLNLVYNPGGAFLPGEQAGLEAAYRHELLSRHGIVFNHVFTITNVPLGRFCRELERKGKREGYQQTLEAAFNAGTLEGLMCRHQLCVDWDGRLYDCDFNLAQGLELCAGGETIRSCDDQTLAQRSIVTGEHCFACTAGAGSSCTGALA
jgi:radical SAM/Cys-rich protein